MDWLKNLVNAGISEFFTNFFQDAIKAFSTFLANVMGTSIDVFKMPLVQNGIKYSQTLAFSLLAAKAVKEAYETYILYQSGDPDADPSGLLIRTAQAVAIITTLPWIVQEIFTFGSKLALDAASLGTGKTGVSDWSAVITYSLTGGVAIPLLCLSLLILLLVVGIQATIRGAELALMSVLGPIMALNLTANNRSIWSSWLKQVIIVCTTQALQIFMLEGALSLLTSQSISSKGLLLIFGWLWVTIKTPKYVQQFVYSTGFTGAVGNTAKQAGSIAIMRMMMKG